MADRDVHETATLTPTAPRPSCGPAPPGAFGPPRSRSADLDVELHYRGHRIRVQVTPERFRLATRPGTAGPVRVGFRDLLVEMRPGAELAWPLDSTNS